MTEMIDTRAIGARIEELRLKRGLSQNDLAIMMGYKSSSTIAKWEIGENIPSGIKLIQLVKILNTSSDHILIGPDETKLTINGDNHGIAGMSGNIEGDVNFNSSIKDKDSVYREKEIVDNSNSDFSLQEEQVAIQQKTLEVIKELLAVNQEILELLKTRY